MADRRAAIPLGYGTGQIAWMTVRFGKLWRAWLGTFARCCFDMFHRVPGNELCAVVAIAQGMDHALQDPERA